MLREIPAIAIYGIPIIFAVTKSVRKAIILKQNGICWGCGKLIGNSLEMHHKVPKKLGGSDQESNIVGLCGENHFDCHNRWDNLAFEDGILPDGTPLLSELMRQRCL